MFVISYRNQEHPRVFAVPDDFTPGYADVLAKSSGHLRQQVSREEMIRVLRFFDPVMASKFYDKTRFRDRKSFEDSLIDGYEDAFQCCEKNCEAYELYEPTPQEEYVQMTQPTPGQKPTASAQMPKKNGGEQKAAAEPKEKKAAPPREKKYPAGTDGSTKITLGTGKDGKRYGPDNNPKKGKSAERFVLYKDGMTIDEALKAGVSIADIRWDADAKRGLIKLG